MFFWRGVDLPLSFGVTPQKEFEHLWLLEDLRTRKPERLDGKFEQ